MFAQNAPTLFQSDVQSNAPVQSRRTSLALLGAAVAIAVTGAGFMARQWVAVAAPKVDAAPPVLGLALSEQSNLVSVRWDRQSPIIAKADRATVSIQNGKFERSIDIDRDQLHNGSLMYGRLPAEATIKLEVFTSRKTSVSEVMHLAGLPIVASAPLHQVAAQKPVARIARVKHRGNSRAKSQGRRTSRQRKTQA